MRKFLILGILSVISLFLPSESRAVPLDVPYQILVSTVGVGSVTLTTATFSGSSYINNNLLSYQWCVSGVVVSSFTSGTTFTMAWSTSTITPSTTDYMIVRNSGGEPITPPFDYRTPYCAPVGQAILKLTSSVSTAVLTVQGYLWKGWN